MTAPGQNLWDSPAQTTDDQGETSPASPPPVSPTPPADLDAMTVYPNAPRRGLSISIKATILAVLFGVLPVLAVSFLAYRSADRSMTETVAEQELEEVDQLASQLGTYLQERVTNVRTIATLVDAFPLYKSDLEAPERARLEQLLSEQLTEFVQDYGTYAGIGVFDLQGNLLVQSARAAFEPNQGDRPYFAQVIETGAAAVSEPAQVSSAITPDGQRSIYVATPVAGESSAVEAVVVAQIPTDLIGRSILGVGVSEEEEEEGQEFYYLVDSSGAIIQSLPASEEGTEIGSSISERILGIDAARENREPQSWIGSASGRKALIAYAPVSGVGDLRWSVVASETTAEAFEAQQQLLRTILLGTALTGIVVVFLGIFLAQRATQPVERVARTVELLGQGNLHARVPVRGNDELAVLGTNVNRMAGRIQTLLQTLNQNAEQLGKQNNVLAGLARNESLIRGDAPAAARAFTEVTATTLDVERVSVWLYEPEQGTVQCLSAYDRGQPEAERPLGAIASSYLQAIADGQGRAVRDVSHHSDLEDLRGGALETSTVSLLEVPIQLMGNTVGLLRCEHVNDPRDWTPQDQLFVSSVANLVALALESDVLQKDVDHLLDVVSEVEDGNLTIQAQVSDRSTGLVADTFNRLTERLTEVLQQTLSTAQQAYSSAQQQKDQADRIASNAEQQAQGINQILQITAEVKSLAQEAARRVDSSRASLQTLQQTVAKGKSAVTTVTEGIDILQEDSDRIIQQMKTLGEFVGLADQFVQDQTQIASLTQTLALNASLVAARAAEQRDPRQFAVAAREFGAIASQVSQLAQQTNESLTTLEQRSAQIQSVVFTVDANVQRVGNLVESFTQGIEQSNQAFESVQAVTAEAVDTEAAVAQASQEIIDAVQSATDVVRTINNIAAQTADLTRDNHMQSEQMETLSEQLLQTIVFFQLPAPKIPSAQLQLQSVSRTQDSTAVT